MGYGPVHNGVNGGSRRTGVAGRPNNVDSWVSLYFVLVCFLRWVHPGPPPLFPPHYNVTNTFAWPCLATIRPTSPRHDTRINGETQRLWRASFSHTTL